MRSINFMNRTSPRIAGVAGIAQHNRKFDVVNMCPFFSVADLRLVSKWNDDTTPSGSFHLISAINPPDKAGSENRPPGKPRWFRRASALM